MSPTPKTGREQGRKLLNLADRSLACRGLPEPYPGGGPPPRCVRAHRRSRFACHRRRRTRRRCVVLRLAHCWRSSAYHLLIQLPSRAARRSRLARALSIPMPPIITVLPAQRLSGCNAHAPGDDRRHVGARDPTRHQVRSLQCTGCTPRCQSQRSAPNVHAHPDARTRTWRAALQCARDSECHCTPHHSRDTCAERSRRHRSVKVKRCVVRYELAGLVDLGAAPMALVLIPHAVAVVLAPALAHRAFAFDAGALAAGHALIVKAHAGRPERRWQPGLGPRLPTLNVRVTNAGDKVWDTWSRRRTEMFPRAAFIGPPSIRCGRASRQKWVAACACARTCTRTCTPAGAPRACRRRARRRSR
jgi:hypothetical protein